MDLIDILRELTAPLNHLSLARIKKRKIFIGVHST